MSNITRTRILFVGAGSGGHFYPLIAIAEACNALPEHPVLYFAGPDPYDFNALHAEEIRFVRIPAGKRRKYRSILNFFDLFKTMYGCLVAIYKLYILYPDVVMSKGGYTSVPIIVAARFLRIPIVVHESDSVMGTANKLALKSARAVIVNYPELAKVLNTKKAIALGIPIRRAIVAGTSTVSQPAFSSNPQQPTVLVIGGSQGAERVNLLILDALDELLSGYTVIHQTGEQHFESCRLTTEKLLSSEEKKSRYHLVPFFDAPSLHTAYTQADIVISRAGSTSIYEIALHGKPSILIPIPEEISHDQRTNAYTYARTSNAVVLEEGNLTPGLLRSEIDRIMGNENLKRQMSTGAQAFGRTGVAEQIRDILIQIGQEH